MAATGNTWQADSLGEFNVLRPRGGFAGERSSSVCLTHAVRGTDTPAIISKFCQEGFI